MNYRIALTMALISTAAFAAGAALADEPPAAATLSSTGPGAATVEPDNYIIGIQDTLEVDVFDVPDLSRSVEVDDDGNIIMPLIGTIQAAGHTPIQLSQIITRELEKTYMKSPIVTVAVKNAASQKITVDGSVTQPGIYQITPHTTLIEAVALAKGPDNVADEHEVEIVRKVGDKQSITTYDLADIRDGKAPDPSVQANDVVVVGVSGSRRFIRDFGNFFATLSLMRP